MTGSPTTFDRIFGGDGGVAVKASGGHRGTNKQEAGSGGAVNGVKEAFQSDGRVGTARDPPNLEGFLGSRKHYERMPHESPGVSALLSPRAQRPQVSQPRASSPRGQRGASPSRVRCGDDEASIHASPPWGHQRARNPPRHSPAGRQHIRSFEVQHKYDIDSFRSIRVFPDSRHYRTSSPLRNGFPGEDDVHERRNGMIHVMPEGAVTLACRRSAASRTDNVRAVAFSPPVSPAAGEQTHTELAFASPRGKAFQPLTRVETRRSVPTPSEETSPTKNQSPQSAVDGQPAAGISSPRCESASGLMPRGTEDAAFRSAAGLGPRRHSTETAQGHTDGGPTGTASPRPSLDQGLSQENTQVALEVFLGERRRRSPGSSPNRSPFGTPPGSPRSLRPPAPKSFPSWRTVAAGSFAEDGEPQDAMVIAGSGCTTPSAPQVSAEARRSAMTVNRHGWKVCAEDRRHEQRFRQRESTAQKNTAFQKRWR